MCPNMKNAVKKMMQKALESQAVGVTRVSCTEKVTVVLEIDGSQRASYVVT